MVILSSYFLIGCNVEKFLELSGRNVHTHGCLIDKGEAFKSLKFI